MDVERIEFETERGTLSALLYMPKGAGANDTRPVIITTHGCLNSKEMQDAPAIEMSRRGYIVLALDMYDHGDSRWAVDILLAAILERFGFMPRLMPQGIFISKITPRKMSKVMLMYL